MVWLVTFILFAVWFVAKVILGKGGFVHALLLTAMAIAVVKLVARYRAAQHQA